MVAVESVTLNYSGLSQLFVWALGFVLTVFVVGFTVGGMMRVLRSA